MSSHPLQKASIRQNLLAQQIQLARENGDEQGLMRLTSQWVHRFGVASLSQPEMTSTTDEPTVVADPPIPTPRFLRRWLPQGGDALPKAS